MWHLCDTLASTPPDFTDSDPTAMRMLNAIRNWLEPARIADQVDRRNAPMMQIILLLIGILPPLAWAYRLLAPSRPVTSGELVTMAMSLLLSALAWSCLVLVRRGRFRLAVRIFLGVALGNMVIAYSATGLPAQLHSMPVNLIWIVMAGLMLGRRELWLAYSALILALAMGLRTDLRHADDHWSYQMVDGATYAIIFLLITIVIDRTVAALRESLAEVRSSHDELERVNRRLREEIVERERAEQKLIHAQKMKAIGRLASGVAHDFNNVLNVVLGYAGRRRGMTDLESAERMLAGVEKAATRGTSIAKRLLGLARQDNTRIETFDAAQTVRETLPMLRQLFPDDVRIEAQAAEGEVPIRFDRGQFDLVMLNIAANARDAMPDGGVFRVQLERDDLRREVRFNLEDNGTGMTPETRDHLFEPFFSTKHRDEGYGLGLAVAESLIVEAGGVINVDSELGRGTVFRIQLPLADLNEPAASQPSAAVNR